MRTLFINTIKIKIMTTKTKVCTAKKSARKVSVNASVMEQVINAASAITAPAGAGVTAGGAGGGSVLPAVPTSYNKVRVDSSAQLDASIERESIDVKKLKSSICARWSAPEWDGAAAVRAALAGVPGMTDEMIEGAVAAAARKSGVDLTAPSFTLSEVLDVIHTTFSTDWARVVGCPADELTIDTAKVYDVNGCVVGAVNVSGTINQLVTDLLSYRNYVAVRRAAAWSRAIAVNTAVSSCWSAGRDCFAAGMSEADALALAASRISAYYAAESARRAAAETDAHNCRVDLSVLNVLLCDALAAGRHQLADKIRGSRRKVLRRLAGLSA